MIDLVRQITALRAAGHEMLLVSSGAIFAGREAMGCRRRRKDIPFKQTLAAMGQVRLMGLYEQFFALLRCARGAGAADPGRSGRPASAT